ncbi:endosome-associated-trafficking regulator 1-like [Phaethornis superciliosus]
MSWLLGLSGTKEKFCPESQGLEDDDDDDDNHDEFSCPCHTSCPLLHCKSYDSFGDSQVEELAEFIPFSLNLKDMVKDEGVKNRTYAKRLAKHALELEKEGQEFQELFYKDMEMLHSLSEDKGHNQNCHLPVHQRLHALQTPSMATGCCCDPFQSNAGKLLGKDAFTPMAHISDPCLGYPEHTREAEPYMLQEEATGEFPSLQLTDDGLREENSMLWRMTNSLKSTLKRQACKVRRLEKQLKASQAKKKRETQELQSFVQQTERSLQLMTQRAVEAESTVEVLKQKVFTLQGELESYKMENKNLRTGQMTDLGAVKHNIDLGLQNLYKIITGANLSVKQLASGVESLNFVAEVLKSAGKISEAEAEKNP